MAKDKEQSSWKKIRGFFNDLHLWGGLACGLVVIAVCFSGTVYVFNTEVKEWSSPELYYVTPATDAPLTPDEVVKRVATETQGTVVSMRTYADVTRAWQVTVQPPAPDNENTSSEKAEPPKPITYLVDPYTANIKGDASVKNGYTKFMSDMFSLHRWLLLDKIEEPLFGELPNRKLGSYITGTATILFTFGLLTGLIIWFPQKMKSWKQGLKIKLKANWKRINHDLHNTLAFYSFIFLLLMGITGPQWSFPWYREGLQKTLGTYQHPDAPKPEPPRSIVPLEHSNTASISGWIAAADIVLPYKGNYYITLPAEPMAAVSINKTHIGFFAAAASDKLMLDQYSAEVLSKDVFSEKPFNQRIAGSIKAIHVGDVYGKFTKILYFLACLVATTLPVTGTIIWINKLVKKRARKGKSTPQQVEMAEVA